MTIKKEPEYTWDDFNKETQNFMGTAPMCHFKKMEYQAGEYDEEWWECSFCGHIKQISRGNNYER